MSLPTPDPSNQVLVTGASSGIGAEIARLLAERGHRLAIVARRRERLDDLAADLTKKHGVEVDVHEHDLGKPTHRKALIKALDESGRPVAGVVNAAGFGTAGDFLTLDEARELEQLEVNVTALLQFTHTFAGPMVDRGEGAILNIASIAAFQPLPGMATYSATKAFVQTFSEAFHAELSGTGVSCTVLCPGPVETEWAETAGAEAVMIPGSKVSPEQVAREAVEGMEKGKRSVVPGVVPQAMARTGHYLPRTVLLPAFRTVFKRRTPDR